MKYSYHTQDRNWWVCISDGIRFKVIDAYLYGRKAVQFSKSEMRARYEWCPINCTASIWNNVNCEIVYAETLDELLTNEEIFVTLL